MAARPAGSPTYRWESMRSRGFPTGTASPSSPRVYTDARSVEATTAHKRTLAADKVAARVTEHRVFRLWDRWLTDGEVGHVFVLDLDTGVLVDLTPDLDRFGATRLAVAPDGRELALQIVRTEPGYDPMLQGVFTLAIPARLRPDGKAPRLRARHVAGASNGLNPAYSPDGRWLVYGIQREMTFYADRVRLVAVDRNRRTQTVLTEDWDRSSLGWTFADRRTLVLTSETHGRSAVYTLDVPAAVRSDKARKPSERYRGGTFGTARPSGGRLWFTEHSVSHPPEVVSTLLSGRGHRVETAFTRPVFDTLAMGPCDEYVFDGADGDPVQMFLVRPADPPRGKLPLVHFIHGGPHSNFGDAWHWRWNAQVLASAGYAVALVNFHGSTSWGQDFAASILGSWGRQPYEDVMRATDLLIEEGIVDARRMAVAGGSYGGYLVSWICSQTDRFACAVNHAGVADLQAQYASDVTQGRHRSMGGEPWDNLEGMDRYNPVRHASGFKTPMLVLHGERDYRVPYTQGLEVYNIYKAMGNEARLVCYPDENHWILKAQNSRHWYGEVLNWLGRYLGRKRRSRR